MVKTPCQQIVCDVLPAIRAALAAELVRTGVSQQEVTRLSDTAPSAISRYLSGKRGYRIVFEEPAQNLIEDLSRDIKAGGSRISPPGSAPSAGRSERTVGPACL